MRKSLTSRAATTALRSPRGFSLIELMVTMLIFSLLAGTIITVLVVSTKQKSATSNEVGSTEMARTAIDMVARDLRTAGFGVDNTYSTPQPPIAYVDSMQILINSNVTPFPDTGVTKRGIPLAYDPNGSPRPKPLVGTSWTPPIRYRTGAETIRWTLDLNNDGNVNTTDLTATDATDAARTPNPDDYELCREVYGDSTGGTLGNNGGARERIALIKRPGGSERPMFRVYMQGSSTPWDWASGPVPANRLQEIVKVEINITTTSPSKNFLGKYSETRLSTTVNEIRNSPNFSFITFNISGTVFNDANKNGAKDGGELGVTGALVTVGGYLSMTTGASGTYSFDVPPGTYVIKQEPPSNYGILSNPDSFVVTVGPAVVKNFADSLRKGGWVTVTVYNDVDKNHSYGGSDKPMLDLAVTLEGDNDVYNTDALGQVVLFAPVGTYKIYAALPDSFIFSTTHPLTGTMTDGATKTGSVGMYIYDSGVVSGTVFNDEDANGNLDGGEKGVGGATITCVLPDSTTLFTYSDNQGKYALRLPVNDPPKTTSYTIVCTPPSGWATDEDMSISGLWLQSNQTLTDKNFALGKMLFWQKDPDDPTTAIVATDLIENDWTGSQTKHARQDADLVTGSDRTLASTVEQWFNQYDSSPLYMAHPNASRSALMTVNALAADTLNAGSGGFSRPDIIAAMRYKSGINWGIWLTQNGSGNEGYLPPTASQTGVTSDNGDVTAVTTMAGATGASPDMVLGTQSPATGQGVIEIWKSSSHSTPNYTRSQTIPTTGGLPGNALGAVSGIVIADVDSKFAGPEMVVGTQTGYYSGQIIVFKMVSGSWTLNWMVTLASDAVTAVCVTDVNDDGKLDIVVGTQTGHTTGNLIYYKNKGGGPPITFDVPVTKAVTGFVTCLAHGDFNGDAIDDIIVGRRASDLTYAGGLEIWYTTSKNLPASGLDPTGGKITNWVTSVLCKDLNYGVWPTSPSVSLPDIAGVTRKEIKKGQIFTLTR